MKWFILLNLTVDLFGPEIRVSEIWQVSKIWTKISFYKKINKNDFKIDAKLA